MQLHVLNYSPTCISYSLQTIYQVCQKKCPLDVELQRYILFNHDDHSTVWNRGKSSGNELYGRTRGDWFNAFVSLHNIIILPAVLSKSLDYIP